MKSIKNTIVGLSLVASVLSVASCEDFLDLQPTGSIVADNAISDAKTARGAVIGVYAQLKSLNFGGGSIHLLGTMPGDNVEFSGSLTQYQQLDNNAYPTNNQVTVPVYQGLYSLINRANWVISDIGKVTDPALGEAEKKQLLGEAYFGRAYGYFELARGWGGVQIQTSPTTGLNVIKGVKRSTQAETYAQAIADLTEAESLLPDDDAATRNRAQKSAARALRARVHLYAGQWAEAETYASQVLANTAKYELVKPYSSFFTAPYLTKESVFELTFSASDQNRVTGWYPTQFGGSFEYRPTAEIVNILNNPALAGSRSALIATSNTGQVYNAQLNRTGLDPVFLIRVAELYLIRAEARAKKASPDLTGAIADLNAVRDRADIAAYSGANDAPSVLQAIEDERRIEFAFEPHRWYDLVRTKRVNDVLDAPVDEHFWLFPLPEADVLADPDL
ncbi:MAG: RagB/SusD family nutrient uptake outer membrane protein, partial [Bacteroidales bacterium]|nr:RagB/SusD family nutrient uptake outer membrane protein [Bacteroidales bacterium]